LGKGEREKFRNLPPLTSEGREERPKPPRPIKEKRKGGKILQRRRKKASSYQMKKRNRKKKKEKTMGCVLRFAFPGKKKGKSVRIMPKK